MWYPAEVHLHVSTLGKCIGQWELRDLQPVFETCLCKDSGAGRSNALQLKNGLPSRGPEDFFRLCTGKQARF